MRSSFRFPHRRVLLQLLGSVVLAGCAGITGRVENDLPSLMAERLQWMDEVAKVKQARSLPVTDAKREAELLNAMALEGAALGLPPAAVRAFFSGQIEAAKLRQREWLAQHAQDPVSPGAGTPDLAARVRPALDAIGKRMLAQLAKARALPDREDLVLRARGRLARAGHSEAVIRAAVGGLKEGLK